MLDHLRLAIPVLPVFVKSFNENRHYFNGDILDLDLPCATRHVSKDSSGHISTGELYHPYESLPSSYTDMAMKFFTDTMNTYPYVELKASPLKLLQGHNVYGFECIKNGACEMLGLLLNAYPKLCEILDFKNIEVLHLDTTYFVKLPHQNMIEPVLQYLSNCSAGHRKSKSIKYNNYVTWGNDSSRYINTKAYGKLLEVEQQFKKLSDLAMKGDKRSQDIIQAMSGVLDFAKANLRFEARICKTYLTKNGYPTNLWQLIQLQIEQPNLLLDLFNIAFKPIFSTLNGEMMKFSSDDEVLDVLRSKLLTINSKGKISYTRANNAFKFYNLIQKLGFQKVKEISSNTTFYRNLDSLLECGISRSYLQNLHRDDVKVIPFVRLIEIKFDQQLPKDYQMPLSKYIDIYELMKVA
uniref:Replication-associated protein G2P n=1 Tax=Dulem virus 65 TaxID=3145776 RepID=A0AAU8BBM1_9VIRU